MQQIERYGVIALVFLLVTIVAVSFWGDNKSPGFWSRLTGRGDARKTEIAKNAAAPEHPLDAVLPLNTNPVPAPMGAQPQTPNAPLANLGANSGAIPGAVTLLPQAPGLVTNVPPAGASGLGMPSAPIANNVPPPAGSPQSSASSAPIAVPPVLPKVAAKPQASELAPHAKDAHANPKVAATNGPSVEYVVQKGDSLASIAQRNLGSSSRWTEIQSLNGGIQPRSLRVGAKLKLPVATTVKSTSEKSAPQPEASVTSKHKSSESASQPGTVYVVKAGETLRSIAEKKLGSADRWKEIVAANPGLDPHRLVVGKSLKLPAGDARESRDSRALVAAALPAGSGESGKPHVR